MIEPTVRTAEDLKVGMSAAFERAVTPEDIQAFASLSGDYNPLHIDPEYARGTNYGGPIAHGAFQVALASAMAGMHLPGRNAVVGAYHSRFPAPLFIPAQVRVQGEVARWSLASQTGTLRVTVRDVGRSTVTADVLVTFGMHEQRDLSALTAPRAVSAIEGDQPLVVITGAGGAIGLRLVQTLAGSYRILALCRSRIPESLSGSPSVRSLDCDLETLDFESRLDAAAGDGAVYGIVHCAWPGAPRGGLLDTDPEVIARQVDFGSLVTIRLARWLSRRASDQARFVALGTTAATIHPIVSLSAYSLGKATLEHTVRLLAPELARQGITMNAVLPSFMPLGMNSTQTRKSILSEAARVPVGRLCAPDDVAAAVSYLLSREASFVTGQIIPLTGGQL